MTVQPNSPKKYIWEKTQRLNSKGSYLTERVLAEEIAAFANASGGMILIGVDDDGEIVGIDRQDLDKTEKTQWLKYAGT